jgi:hypothetical protein
MTDEFRQGSFLPERIGTAVEGGDELSLIFNFKVGPVLHPFCKKKDEEQ